MKTGVTEKQIQNAIIEYLRYRPDVYFIRNNSFFGRIQRNNGSWGFIQNNKPGAPDIVACVLGRFVGWEVKVNNGRQSDLQKNAELEIKRAGGFYFIVRSLDDVMNSIEHIKQCISALDNSYGSVQLI